MDKYVETRKKFQPPRTGKELASLPGFVGNYREFIPEYLFHVDREDEQPGQIGTEGWMEEIDSDFQALKTAFVTNGVPVRHFPISRGSPGCEEFILHIDWS